MPAPHRGDVEHILLAGSISDRLLQQRSQFLRDDILQRTHLKPARGIFSQGNFNRLANHLIQADLQFDNRGQRPRIGVKIDEMALAREGESQRDLVGGEMVSDGSLGISSHRLAANADAMSSGGGFKGHSQRVPNDRLVIRKARDRTEVKIDGAPPVLIDKSQGVAALESHLSRQRGAGDAIEDHKLSQPVPGLPGGDPVRRLPAGEIGKRNGAWFASHSWSRRGRTSLSGNRAD